ncbi:hypothetical protein N577_002535, partial [Lacticaseibacillus rhamnosus 2166]
MDAVVAREVEVGAFVFWLMPITRSPAQGSACKDIGGNGQSPAI